MLMTVKKLLGGRERKQDIRARREEDGAGSKKRCNEGRKGEEGQSAFQEYEATILKILSVYTRE